MTVLWLVGIIIYILAQTMAEVQTLFPLVSLMRYKMEVFLYQSYNWFPSTEDVDTIHTNHIMESLCFHY